VAPVHDRGVELVGPVPGEHRALAGVEQRRILHDDDRRLDRVERVAAVLEHLDPGIERRLERGLVGRPLLGRHLLGIERACPAVDGQRPLGGVLGERRWGHQGESDQRGEFVHGRKV